MRKRRSLTSDDLMYSEAGSALIEFSVSAGIVLALTFGILDASRAMFADHFVATAARSATRYAMVRGSTWSGVSCASTATYECAATEGDVTRFVRGELPLGLTPENLTASTTWLNTNPAGLPCDVTNGTNSPGCVVKVRVNYRFNFVLPFLPVDTLTLASTSALAVTR